MRAGFGRSRAWEEFHTMKLLILGGTQFLGRALAVEALARGHELALFHRGRTNPHLFPEAVHLLGDRDGDLAALDGQTWDAVIDTCGYFPRVAGASARKLAGQVDRYCFISSISAYADFAQPGIDESCPTATMADETIEEITGESYGPLKVLCERAVEAALPGRSLIIRPGLIVGPHDPTDRFTYWPARFDRGGAVLAPGEPETPIQMIDGRDLAAWTLDLVAAGGTGVYNADSPAGALTMGALISGCQAAAGREAAVHWLPDDFLLAKEVQPWQELPLWIPAAPDFAGFMLIDCSRAAAAGLTCRPLGQTIHDTLQWHRARPGETMRDKLTPEKEAAILRAWQARDDG